MPVTCHICGNSFPCWALCGVCLEDTCGACNNGHLTECRNSNEQKAAVKKEKEQNQATAAKEKEEQKGQQVKQEKKDVQQQVKKNGGSETQTYSR